MQPPCALCSTLLPILEKYSSLELIEAIDLQKDDICTFVSFVSNWPQTRCACLCRDATTIERFSSLVEWLLLYIINFLQTFTISEQQLSDDDQTNSTIDMETSSSSSQICSILTTTDQEQQRQYRQWSLEEKERLLLCVARCFTLSLPIYTTAHRNPTLANHVAYYQMQHLSADFKTFLSSYCHLNLASTNNNNNPNSDAQHISLYLYRHICSFCENRGLIVIRQVFESAKNTRMLPLPIAHALFAILTNLRHHLNVDIIKNFLLPIRPHAIRYMCLLSDNELRLCGQKNTNDLLYASLKDFYLTTTFRQRSTSSTNVLSPYHAKHHHTIQFQRYHFDRLMLTLALKYLTCSTLTIRLTGLSHITNQIQQCLEYTQYRRHQSMNAAAAAAAAVAVAAASCCTHPNTTQEIFTVSESDGEDEQTQKLNNDTSSSSSSSSTSSTDDNDDYSSANSNHHERKLANWIIENKIIDYLFGPNLHTELLKQCLTILIFLATNNRLTVEHIDLIWSCVSLTHCSRHILDLLMNLGQKNLHIHLLNHLLQLIGQSDRSQYTESTLSLISILTKSYWNQLIRSTNSLIQNKKQQEYFFKQKFSQRDSLNMQNLLRQQKTLKRQQLSPLKRIDRNKNLALIRHRNRIQQAKTSPTNLSRSIAGKKQQSAKMPSNDDDSTEEVIIVGSPQQSQQPQQTLIEQNVLKLMANKCKDFPAQNLLKTTPTSGLILRGDKNKNDETNQTNLAADDWSEEDDEEDEEENTTNNKTTSFNRANEPTSSNDDEDEDESENEAHIISREVLMQHRQRFQRNIQTANQDESDDDETITNVHPNLGQMYKAEDLTTPIKRPPAGAGFIINSSKTLVLPDDQMDIDDDDDDPNEISDDELRGIVSPNLVPTSLKQQLNRQTKEQLTKDHRTLDDEEIHLDQELNSSRKKYQEKICSSESAEDASQAGSLPSEMETEIYDCRDALERKKKRSRQNLDDDDDDDDDDDEEEGDFGSSASDVLSETGSAKNMADFEDMSESEQQQQQANTPSTPSSTAAARRMRIKHKLNDSISSAPTDASARKQDQPTMSSSSSSSSSSSAESTNDSSPNRTIDEDEINISNLSSPGQTLLWDLLQDNASHLPDSLLNETERLFSHVLSSIEDKRILLHFIQACLDNLKKSTSSLISLRLLPKLFLIFQQHQQRINTNIFLIFEDQYHVLNVFFNDLEQLTKRLQTTSTCTQNEITVRLQFLSFIFSITASPKEFHLTQNQADKLWDCLTIITGSTGTNREDIYNWFLSQLKNRDGGHALSLETFKHLLIEKLLTQKPEHVSCQQLNLIQEILQQSRTNWVHFLQQQTTTNLTQQMNDFQNFENLILNYISDVAMRALDQNVSTLAAQILNSYQIQNEDGTLDREETFIARCMNCLIESMQTIQDISSLRTINRIAVLLRTHLELFMRRYSYVIRLYQSISQTNQLFSSTTLKPHVKQLTINDERETNQIKLICNAPIPSGATDKFILKMSPNETIGDLRAELTRWYCTLKPSMTNVLTQTLLTNERSDNSSVTFDLLHMSNLPSIRVLANGQELDRDIDDKTLSDCNIKDNQTILINASTRNRTKDLYNIDERLLKTYIPHKMPMMLLLKYIDEFFSILSQLQNFLETSSEHADARLVICRLWEILLLIPTHNGMLQKLAQLNDFQDQQSNTEQWSIYLQRTDPYRLTYSLQIIDMLIKRLPAYRENFVQKGGLKYLYDLFISKSFFTGPIDRSWCAALPDALLYTLKILCSCLLKMPTANVQTSPSQVPLPTPPPPPTVPPPSTSTLDEQQHSPRTPMNTRKKARRDTGTPAILAALTSTDLSTIESTSSSSSSSTHSTANQQSHFHIYEPHRENIQSIDKELFLDTLIDIQLSIVTKSTRVCCPVVLLQYANRTDLLHTSMILFITLCHTFEDIRKKFIEHEKLSLWLKTLLLDSYDSMLKREAQLSIFRLCMVSNQTQTNQSSGTNDELNLQPISDFSVPLPTQRSCSIDDEKASQTLTISSSIEISTDPPTERPCLVPILTNLLELIPYALKFTTTSNTTTFPSNIDLQTLNLSSIILTKCDNHSIFLNQSSHEYFLLLTSIIDRMHSDEIKQIQINKNKLGQDNFSNEIIRFDHELIEILINFIHEHIPYETQREKLIEDEVLYGLLCVLTSIAKQFNNLSNKKISFTNNHSYKQLTFDLIERVFKYLFELPTSENRCVPKCKSLLTRSKSYEFLLELIKINRENFIQLLNKLLEQHNSIDRQQQQSCYIWDYWPRDDGRSYPGYVGLTNLGATCYAATSIQHLYMIPELRTAVLNANKTGKHDLILYELKRMFAYLLESERRSYNPKSFCKVYTMDGLLSLNTGDQKDMTEFFTDLITKLEEMSDDLKQLVRELFCGILTNIVISFDCPHISRKLEEFYTVRCQVADMKDVHESLAELTVKDTLEGDNMYTCSKCSKKVRAEKRVCFRKLPKILCLNTMRYTFNMVTMQREKVNTLFQFPMQLDMSGYMETNLIDKTKLISDDDDNDEEKDSNKYLPSSPLGTNESHLFELIGVTVHTGTAEGGHYYSFIRERVKRPMDMNNSELNFDNQNQSQSSQQQQQHRWYLFNDAEVKQFDPSQIANECFGGEITSKGYDQGSDRFLDFQFEKTHSAYMLFYERIDTPNPSLLTTINLPTLQLKDPITYTIPKDISDWIWEDNRRFVRDRHLFDHHYFTFMWTLCHHQMPAAISSVSKDNDQQQQLVPQTNPNDMLPIQLAITFVFETYIHAKDKPTMTGWVEYLCKQFTACKPVAIWFLAHMTRDDTWLTKVLVRCPNHTIRHMFARVLLDVLHKSRFRDSSNDESLVVQQFIRKYLSIISDGGARLPIRYMSEYFIFLHDFARNGIDECYLLLDCQCIQQLITFYMLHRGRQPKQSSSNMNDDGNTSSDDENQCQTNLLMSGNSIDDDIIPLNPIRLSTNNNNLNRPIIFEKMFPLIALLLETERTRSNFEQFQFDLFIENDFAFIQQQIFDNINLKATAHIIQLICYKNEVYANKIVNLLSQWIMNSTNDINCLQALFKVLTYLIEQNPNHLTTTNTNEITEQVPSTLVLDKNWCDFASLIVVRIGKLIDICPTQVFEWFNNVVNKSSIIHRWIYTNIRQWLKSYLLYNTYTKVRTLIAQLLVSLVPSAIFRQTYRTGKYFLNLSKQQLASTAQTTTTTTTQGTITSLLTFNQQISTLTNSTSFSALFDHQQFAQYPSDFTTETYTILRTLLSYLLELLVEIGHDQSELHMNDNQQRLVQYLSVIIHFTRYSPEKNLLSENEYLHSLCSLICHPKLTEDHTINNGNKLLIFILLQQLLSEKIFLTSLLNSEHELKQQLPMCLIIVDHEDQELILYNRLFLFIYYYILKQFCQTSWIYAKELASHKNMSWALKNVLPYVHLYPDACEQLVSICKTILRVNLDECSTEDQKIFQDFRLELYGLIYRFTDIRSSWTIVLELTRDMCDLQSSHDERLQILQQRGLPILTTIFFLLFQYYHEQTCTHQNDFVYLLNLLGNLLDTIDVQMKKNQINLTNNMKSIVGTQWKEKMELISKLLLLLNSFNTNEIRQRACDLLKKIIVQLSIQDLTNVAQHVKTTHEHAAAQSHPQLGPYFPRRKQPTNNSQQGLINASIHTQFRPHFGMFFKTQLLETSKGRDLDFDRAVHAYYSPYHTLIDSLARYAYNQNALNGSILNLVTLVACEGIQSMHLTTFAKLCLEISDQSKTSAQTLIHDLLQPTSFYYFNRFIEIILIDERISLYQNDNYLFLHTYLPMILSLKKSSPTTTTNDSTQTAIQRFEQLLTKTCENCLHSIYNESQTNLDWIQSNKKLFKTIHYSHMQLGADIKALEIYLHCQLINDKTTIEHVINESIQFIEQHLQLTLNMDDEQQQDTESTSNDEENTPIKKRRLDENDTTNTDPKRKEITDALQILQAFLTNIRNSTNQPNTIEQ